MVIIGSRNWDYRERNTGDHLKIHLILKIHAGLTPSIYLRKRWVTFRLTGQTCNSDRHTNSSEGSRARMLGRNYRYITDSWRITDQYMTLQTSSWANESCIYATKTTTPEKSVCFIPIDRIDNNSSGVGHVSLQQGFPALSSFFQPGNSNGFPVAIIGPIQIISNPVHCYAFHIIKICWERENNSKRLILFRFYMFTICYVISMSCF